MGTKPKMFAKTGVAIIESTSAMNVDHIEKLWFHKFTNAHEKNYEWKWTWIINEVTI